MMSPDEKQRIRHEFENGGKSLYWLAANNPVPYSTLWATANRERWGRYGARHPEPVSTHLESRLKAILMLVLDRLDAELSKTSTTEPVSASVHTRLDTAFKTYLKLLDLQAKLETDKMPASNKGQNHPLPTTNRIHRDALVKSLLRRFDVLRISGETEIRNLLSDRS